ncbi:unnamed protein product [Clavelina lepadiformis]|uniref:Uncharacterized protein n=1 Tax=Clavelina lepadiformis TaxID=159417 RepID=A0ABP0EZ56_CLALP
MEGCSQQKASTYQRRQPVASVHLLVPLPTTFILLRNKLNTTSFVTPTERFSYVVSYFHARQYFLYY